MRTYNDGTPIPIVGWWIKFGDGTEVKGDTTLEWTSAATVNVQIILIFYDYSMTISYGPTSTRTTMQAYATEILAGSDYYWMNLDASIGNGNTLPLPNTIIGAVKAGGT